MQLLQVFIGTASADLGIPGSAEVCSLVNMQKKTWLCWIELVDGRILPKGSDVIPAEETKIQFPCRSFLRDLVCVILMETMGTVIAIPGFFLLCVVDLVPSGQRFLLVSLLSCTLFLFSLSPGREDGSSSPFGNASSRDSSIFIRLWKFAAICPKPRHLPILIS